MNEFKVFPKPGLEVHMKMALKSFDKDVVIKSQDGGYLVSTSLKMDSISSLSSVKQVTNHSPSFDDSSISFDEDIQRALTVDVIQLIITGYLRNRSASQYPHIIYRDIDRVRPDEKCDLTRVFSWKHKYPTTTGDNPFVKIDLVPSTVGLDTIIMYYCSSKLKFHYGI
jgi:hypothetical protein